MPEWMMLNCGECGIEFQVPEIFYRERRTRAINWFCPNGHSRVFRETEVDLLRRRLERAEQENARLAGERDQAHARATREQKARLRIERRVHNGICPECNRSFANVKRHMATKHKPTCEVVKLAASG